MTNNDRIQFVGHSCLWVTLDDQHILVDTNLSQRLFGLIKRRVPIGIDLNNLPDVSCLLVSHAHYDHLDIFSYKYFSQDKPIISPVGLGKFINRFVHNPIVELKPWKTHQIGSIKITAVPTKHWGFRWTGIRYTKCNGYIIQGSKSTIFAAGDSGYDKHFKEIGNKFKIDIACLPIGSYRPRWIMKARHMDPLEALKAFKDLKAKKMIPIHWGSFRLALDKIDEPLIQLKQKLTNHPARTKVAILHAGESLALA